MIHLVRRTTVLTLTLAWVFASWLPNMLAQEVPKPDPEAVPWKGEPLSLTCGVNNGVRKVYLRVNCREGRPPFCSLQFRNVAKDSLSKEIFQHYVAPSELVYVGTSVVKDAGNDFRNLSWVSPSRGIRFDISHPVKTIGKDLVAFFTRLGYLEPNRTPFVLVTITDPPDEGKIKESIHIPLMDISNFKNPKRALMGDAVPFARDRGGDEVIGELTNRYHAVPDEGKLKILARLDAIATQTGVVAEGVFLIAKLSPNKEIKARGLEICRRRKIYSAADLSAALRNLKSEDLKQVHHAVSVIHHLGWKARVQGIPAVEKCIARTDLPKETRELATKALERMRQSPKPPRTPLKKTGAEIKKPAGE